MQYAIVHNSNTNSLIALPSTDVLDDLAFLKGWRILTQDLTWVQLEEWKTKFNLEVMDAVKFHLDYVADEEMTDEDVDYINSLSQDFFTENQPDADDDEIDVEFFGEEAQEEEEIA